MLTIGSLAEKLGLEIYIEGEQPPGSVRPLDPSAPIYVDPLGIGPADRVFVTVSSMRLAFSEREVIGDWALNVDVPGRISEVLGRNYNGGLDNDCSAAEPYRRNCGAVLSFSDDGVGEVDNRKFVWRIGRCGSRCH